MGGTVWGISVMGINGLAITYLSSVAFAVGRRSRFDRCVLKPALSTWLSPFWRLSGRGLTAAFPPILRLRHLTPCVSRLAGGDCWRPWGGLCKAGSGLELSSVVLGEPGGGRWSSSAARDDPSCDGWRSSAACVWRH